MHRASGIVKTILLPAVIVDEIELEQEATFSPSIYFYKLLYKFQAVPPPIIRSTKLYIQGQVLSN